MTVDGQKVKMYANPHRCTDCAKAPFKLKAKIKFKVGDSVMWNGEAIGVTQKEPCEVKIEKTCRWFDSSDSSLYPVYGQIYYINPGDWGWWVKENSLSPVPVMKKWELKVGEWVMHYMVGITQYKENHYSSDIRPLTPADKDTVRKLFTIDGKWILWEDMEGQVHLNLGGDYFEPECASDSFALALIRKHNYPVIPYELVKAVFKSETPTPWEGKK